MTPPKPKPRKRRISSARSRAIKDRLIQTRVPERLESVLKEEARKRRLSVSHLIRNMLEDTFHLVDNVVAEVDNLVQDSVGLARQVRRDAERIAQHARGDARTRTEEASASAKKTAPRQRAEKKREQASAKASAPFVSTTAQAALDSVLAWNKVVMNRDGVCAKCGRELSKGDDAHLGLTGAAGAAPVWLCNDCL